MSFLDKLKNVFFEEEEVDEEEVEERPKLARKVEIPKKKPVVVLEKEELEEEVKPKEVDNEIKVEKIEREIKVEPKEEPVSNLSMMFEEEDFVIEDTPKVMSRDFNRERLERKELYPDKKEESYTESIKKDNNYGYTKSYYESKETKTFTPSPIISPIYGILDKNYKKEEVITRREIKITSNRDKVDLDSVRSKAFGESSDEIKKEVVTRVEKEEKIYDVNTTKPSVRGVTLEDADEYYRDLGLAYNVDYSDKGKDKSISRTKEKESKLEDNLFDLIESMYDKED